MSVETPKLAFDQRKYLGLNSRSEFVSHYSLDLAALCQEASTLRSVNYTPVTYLKLDDHTLVCPDYDPKRDINSYNNFDGFFEVQCTFASEAVRDILLHTEQNGLVVWISPSLDPNQPFLSRLNLYLKHRTLAGQEVVDSYSVTWCQSADYCLRLGNLVRILSDQPRKPPIQNLNDLRQTAQFIPLDLHSGDNFWQQAARVFPLPEGIWTNIISGQARKNFDQAKVFAEKRAVVAYAELSQLGLNAPYPEYIKAGARSESYMDSHGYPIGNTSDCDHTNTSVLSAWGTVVNVSLYSSSSSEATCPEIKCASCSWKPTTSQLVEISAKKLTCCPDCGWVPGTSVLTRSQTQVISTITHTSVPEIKYSTQTSISSSSAPEVFSLSWVDYYFLPWLVEAWYN